jgi:hypothetical protein
MTPELADRLAKLLRLACCETAPDGERQAAIGRLSAIAAANDVDWDLAFANGNGVALDQEAASRIYWEGHARGCTETEQRLRPVRDWSPVEGTKGEIGPDTERLAVIMKAAAESRDAGLLSDWEVTFSNNMRERLERFGARMYVSAKQWECLDRLEAKLRRQDFLE